MFVTFSARLKSQIPKLHQFLKQTLARTRLPVPKLLLGRPVLAHRRLLTYRHNEPHVLRWIAKVLHSGDICFDVGAHHGWMSMVAARRIGRKGRVVAFEPSPRLVEFLSYHKRVNRLPQVDIVPKAVAHTDGFKVPFHLFDDGNSSMNYLAGLNVPGNSLKSNSSIDIETVTLDTFSRVTGLIPNLIKIDVEGAELWVCQGAKQLLAAHRPILIIATHPIWLPEGQLVDDLFELLEDLGYRIVESVIWEYRNANFGDYLFIAN